MSVEHVCRVCKVAFRGGPLAKVCAAPACKKEWYRLYRYGNKKSDDPKRAWQADMRMGMAAAKEARERAKDDVRTFDEWERDRSSGLRPLIDLVKEGSR